MPRRRIYGNGQSISFGNSRPRSGKFDRDGNSVARSLEDLRLDIDEAFYDLEQTNPSQVVLFAPSATDPAGTPSAGDMYFNTAIGCMMVYDAVRSKWLSTWTETVQFGEGTGATPAGAYYDGIDGMAFSDVSGLNAPFNGTVIGVTYTRDDTDAATFEVTADGSAIAELASSAVSGASITLDGDFTSGAVIGIRNKAGSNDVDRGRGIVLLRWRA